MLNTIVVLLSILNIKENAFDFLINKKEEPSSISIDYNDMDIIMSEDGIDVVGNKELGLVVYSDNNVIGYTYKYDGNTDFPPAFIEWLNANKKAPNYRYGLELDFFDYDNWPENVPFMCSARWNQWYPYNEKCPLWSEEDGKCPIGCTAVGLGEIMYKYRYPETFDWNNIKSFYSKNGNYTEEEVSIISDFMFTLAETCETSYRIDGSWSSPYSLYKALIKFGYTCEYVYNDNTLYNAYYEIANKRPMIFAIGGHIFVFDGYNYKKEIHVNWGYGGTMDGYYDMRGYLATNGGGQSIIGIMPNNTVNSINNTVCIGKETCYGLSGIKYDDLIDGINIVKNGSNIRKVVKR